MYTILNEKYICCMHKQMYKPEAKKQGIRIDSHTHPGYVFGPSLYTVSGDSNSDSEGFNAIELLLRQTATVDFLQRCANWKDKLEGYTQ